MVKKRVSVQIEGRNYALITSDDEKYVESVAEEITKRIRKAAQSGRHLDTRDCAVLVALDLCDDRNKAQKKNKDIVGKADKIIQTTNELNKSCKEYKEKLTEAINENTSLTRKVKALEKQVKALTNENEALKSQASSDKMPESPDNTENPKNAEQTEKTPQERKAEKLMGYVPMRQYSLFDEDDKK